MVAGARHLPAPRPQTSAELSGEATPRPWTRGGMRGDNGFVNDDIVQPESPSESVWNRFDKATATIVWVLTGTRPHPFQDVPAITKREFDAALHAARVGDKNAVKKIVVWTAVGEATDLTLRNNRFIRDD